MPSDIEIRRNHIAAPLTWKAGGRGCEGTVSAVKNLLGNACRVVIEDNLLEIGPRCRMDLRCETRTARRRRPH